MNRKYAIVILMMLIVSMVFADTVSLDGSLDMNAQAFINVGFLYDPATMHRYTFGFTEKTDISWDGQNGDLGNSVLALESVNDIHDPARSVGKGDVNLYRILRTDSGVKAYIYMGGPLIENGSGDTVDLKLTFNVIKDSFNLKNIVLDAKYGVENGSLIYSRPASESIEIDIGYLPIHIESYSVLRDDQDHQYTGSIGLNIVVE